MSEHNPDDLPIFVQWIDFLAWLLPTTEKFPHKVRFTFANRVANPVGVVAQCLLGHNSRASAFRLSC
jgi:hypothetical protein